MNERLQLYRSLSKRLLHELAHFLEAEYSDEDIGFLAEEDSGFRTFRKGVEMLQQDNEVLSKRTVEVMARIVVAHADYFVQPLSKVEDKDL